MTRANNFDGLRLIAAFMVLASHMLALSGRWEPRFFRDHSFGNLGVLIFFSISGYLVSKSWANDPNLGRFLAKRLLRVLPGLALSVPLTYAAVRAMGLQGFPDNPLHLLNGSLWTIPFEIYCYLILAGVAMITPRPALVFTAGMLVAYRYLPSSFLSYFGLFFAAGALLHEYPALRSLKALVCFSLAAVIAHHDSKVALALIVPALAVFVGTRSWPVLRRGGRFGDLSYGVYIYAWPVQQVVVATLGSDAGYLTLIVPSLTVTLAMAWFSWRFVESPALARKPLGVGELRGGRGESGATGIATDTLGDSNIIDPAVEVSPSDPRAHAP